MDSIDILSSVDHHLGWLGAGLVFILWSLFRFIVQPQRLVIMAGSALATMFMKASTIRGMRQAIDYRMLPVNPKPSSAKSHRENALNACQRMREYLDIRRMKKSDREGPYAVQQMIEDLYDQDFQLWQQWLKEKLVEFDRLEEIVHRKLYKLKWETDEIWRQFAGDIEARDAKLMRMKVRWAFAIKHLHRQRALRGFWQRVRVVRKCRRAWKALDRLQIRDIKARDRQIRKLEKDCNLVLKPHLGKLHDFEIQHLVNNVPVFQADWASAQHTVELGRTLQRLAHVANARTREVRAMLKLEHLPDTREALVAFARNELKGRVGLNPNSQDEDIVETWLRVYYFDLGPENCPDLEPLGSHGFYLWVCQLVPPGAKGLAQQNSGHLAGERMGWLTQVANTNAKPEAKPSKSRRARQIA